MEQMAVIKPALMNTSFKTPECKRAYGSELLKAFRDAQINTPAHIQRGIDRMRLDESDFAPSIGKFVSWCKPSLTDYGLPSVELAHREACINAGKSKNDRKWTHVAIYHASMRTGYMELSSSTQENTRKVFKQHYEALLEEIINGKELEEPLRLEKPKHIPSSKAVASKGINDLKQIFNK